MIIHGLQKLTLLDFPGRIACTVFTGGCNFRCPFCHNASLVTHVDPKDIMKQDEFFDFLRHRKGVLDGVAITGGEPTLMMDLPEFMEECKKEGFAVKLDTNGSNPDILQYILDNKLADYVAMDIKNSKERYGETVGLKNFDIGKIERSVEILMNSGADFEFRTTVVKEFHDEQSFEKIGQWLQGEEKYFLQCFKDSGDLISEEVSGETDENMTKYLASVRKYIPKAEIRGM